jgi:hypothetical protein
MAQVGSKVTTGVDTFSFGIMMWELYTSHSAYNGMGRDAIIDRVYKKQIRPQFPAGTPVMYAELAQTCWGTDAVTRPSFNAIIQRLNEMLQAFHTGSYDTIGGEAGGSVSDTNSDPATLQQQQLLLLPQQQVYMPQLRPQLQQQQQLHSQPPPGFMHVQVGSFAGNPHVVLGHPWDEQQMQQVGTQPAGTGISLQQLQQQKAVCQPSDLDQSTGRGDQQQQWQQQAQQGAVIPPQQLKQQDHGEYSGSIGLDALAGAPQQGLCSPGNAGLFLGQGLGMMTTPAVAAAVAKARAAGGVAVPSAVAAATGSQPAVAAEDAAAVALYSQPGGVGGGPVFYGPGVLPVGTPEAAGGLPGVYGPLGQVVPGPQYQQMFLEQWKVLCQQQQQQLAPQLQVLPPQVGLLPQQQVLMQEQQPQEPMHAAPQLGALAPQQELMMVEQPQS